MSQKTTFSVLPIVTNSTSRISAVLLAAILAAPNSPASEDDASFCATATRVPIGLKQEVPEQLRCLAINVYFEARGSNDAGQIAVAYVILNRRANGKYPSTICGVVHQGSDNKRGCQFSWVCDGRDHSVRDAEAWSRVVKNSCLALSAAVPDPTNGALIYHATTMLPSWATAWRRTVVIGGHVFYTPLKP
jgi:spore germination cell wall hydrolase CwlJ-like protein